MIRVIFLLSISDNKYRSELIKASVEGRIWRTADTRKKITDKDMLDLANSLHGWTENVYRFGCSFIHLSRFHDYNKYDPIEMITNEEKNAILKYMQYYHGGPHVINLTFYDLVPYLPNVFEKINSNLECYLAKLESGHIFKEAELI